MEKTAREALQEVVDAWEVLPGGRDYAIKVIARWLVEDMKPAIDEARVVLKRLKSDG